MSSLTCTSSAAAFSGFPSLPTRVKPSNTFLITVPDVASVAICGFNDGGSDIMDTFNSCAFSPFSFVPESSFESPPKLHAAKILITSTNNNKGNKRFFMLSSPLLLENN